MGRVVRPGDLVDSGAGRIDAHKVNHCIVWPRLVTDRCQMFMGFFSLHPAVLYCIGILSTKENCHRKCSNKIFMLQLTVWNK